MCGIFGIVNGNRNLAIDRDRVGIAARCMNHRGPDAFGQWGIANRVEFAHLRLAIIDLNPNSNQPFISNSGRYVMVFNGEIYNYIEIRAELVALGHNFRTQSDTEVLLNAYIEWGDLCVTRFNGDWAFAIYDREEGVLFCSRDRFGVKPFNYAVAGGQFVFASEIKSILGYFPGLRRPNYNIIANYCRNGLGAQHAESWFDGVFRLPPAHNLTWKNGQVAIRRYWDYPTAINRKIQLQEAAEEYKRLFVNAVRLRMRSDVPVGTTLSSGIDSGSIVSVLRTFYADRHQTFTAVFGESEFRKSEKGVYREHVAMDESRTVSMLANELGLESHFIADARVEFIEELAEVINSLESGHSSPATISLARVLRKAKAHVTVLLEGQGADELLGGYIINILGTVMYQYMKAGRLWQAERELVAFHKNYSLGYAGKMFVRLLDKKWIEKVYHKSVGIDRVFGARLSNYNRIAEPTMPVGGFDDDLNRLLWRAHVGGLVNLLHYGDALSMAQSLESRLPFMDVNVVHFAFTLPFDMKMKNGLGKYIHRYSMRGIVPPYILENPIKHGFNTPLAVHFEKGASANAILLSERCRARDIYDHRGLTALINEQTSGATDRGTLLFRLLSVELWFRRFIDTRI